MGNPEPSPRLRISFLWRGKPFCSAVWEKSGYKMHNIMRRFPYPKAGVGPPASQAKLKKTVGKADGLLRRLKLKNKSAKRSRSGPIHAGPKWGSFELSLRFGGNTFPLHFASFCVFSVLTAFAQPGVQPGAGVVKPGRFMLDFVRRGLLIPETRVSGAGRGGWAP